ncbi:MAG: DUF2550 family protein [Dermatophilus congolensis]|nr:DUF2550 family protein [Dermatophilus congolensis]
MYRIVELALIVLVLAPLLFVISILVRRAIIARGAGISVCALRTEGSHRWRSGMVALSPTAMEWYPFVGVTTSPSHKWIRPTLEVGRASPIDGDPPWLLAGLPSLTLVPCEAEPLTGAARQFAVIVPGESYKALRSWSESSPPTDTRHDY